MLQRPWVALMLAVVWLAATPATTGEILSGENWRRLPPAARAAYVSGIIDAWSGLALTQESLGTKDQAITVFADVVGCVRDRALAASQVLDLVERYAEDNPGLRNKEMPDLVFAALTQRCRR
ncbi:MAG: hypothetical protein E6J50_09265 [Chloroflexi bacterium]|nr:MAG: hypothetical protein E6J50_09265 [Chloroflexota bacterium]